MTLVNTPSRLPVVIIILLMGSWFLSMYLTPYMCYWFMKPPKKEEGKDSTDGSL